MHNDRNRLLRAVRPLSAPTAVALALRIVPVWLAVATVAIAALALLAMANTLYCRRPDPHLRLIALATALRPTAGGQTIAATLPVPTPHLSHTRDWSNPPRHRRVA